MTIEGDLDYQLTIPPGLDRYAIGILGAGFIVRDCHLPAYRQAGLRVEAIASRTRERAEEVARQHGVTRIYDTPSEMLEDPEIDVIDVAVPPGEQLEIVRQVVRHADHVKGLLAQKPLAMNPADAREIVRLCREAPWARSGTVRTPHPTAARNTTGVTRRIGSNRAETWLIRPPRAASG